MAVFGRADFSRVRAMPGREFAVDAGVCLVRGVMAFCLTLNLIVHLALASFWVILSG